MECEIVNLITAVELVQGGTILGRPHKIQDMGDTHITLHLFEDFLRGLQPKFR